MKAFFRLVVLAAFVLLIFVVQNTAHAQTVPPTPTPDPQSEHLQNQIEHLQDQVDQLDEKLDSLSGINQVAVTVIGIAISVIISFIGGMFIIAKYASTQAKRQIDKAIYRIDPTNAIIRMPEDNFDLEREYIRSGGFFQLNTYRVLDNTCLAGVVIVRLRTDEDTQNFARFLDHYKPDPHKVAYLLYTSLRIGEEVQKRFVNMTFANLAPNLRTQLFTLAYGMLMEKPSDD